MQKAKLIIKYSKILKDEGILPGSSGNISIRIKDRIFITPSGISKDELTFKKISQIDINGNILNKIPPSSEYKMHIEIYRKRPDVNAIIHAHPQFVLICLECNIKLKYITVEFEKNVGKPIYLGYLKPGSNKLAKKVAEASLKSNLIILQNHGIVTIGKDISQARIIAEDAENLFKINYFISLLKNKT
ncbi:MAG: class II aldolase/adducin family protein [Elusimicrobiales bacterium]|nr:class II aldolase/adducin family protein [Elusimicrobiales bacterium]